MIKNYIDKKPETIKEKVFALAAQNFVSIQELMNDEGFPKRVPNRELKKCCVDFINSLHPNGFSILGCEFNLGDLIMNYDDNGYSEVYAKYLTNIINKGNIIEIDNHLYRPDLLEEYLKTKGF